MDAKEIIHQLYNDGVFRQVARQIATSDYADDLEHELVIYCYDRPERVEQLHASGALTFYIVRAAINLFRGKTSPFQRKYRHNEERAALGEVEQVDEKYSTVPDHLYRKAEEEMDKWAAAGKYPYDKNLFLLWLELGNKKLINRNTGIPYRSICYTIDLCRQRLKLALQDDYNDFIGGFDSIGDGTL